MSYLEEALSLSRSGGIYFEGARVDSDPRQMILFVGLGGTGADAIIRIKNQVANRMKLPTDPNTGMPVAEIPSNIAFLAVDTDESAQKKTCGNTRFAPHGKEFLPIGVPDTAAAILAAKQQKRFQNPAYQWVNDGLRANGGAAGAGGKRQVGRLLLFSNVDSVYGKLTTVIHGLATNNPTANKLQIIIVSGIGGGTGSGTFLDMGYLCGKAGRAQVLSTRVFGYFVMPDVNEARGGLASDLRTNGFAALKELDYLLNQAEQDKEFHQVYSPAVEVSTTKPPYDFVHVINGSDTQGHTFHYDKIMQSLAESAFSYIAGEVTGNAPAMESMYDNIAQYQATHAGNGNYPACNHYLSVGAAMLRVPYTEIATLLACRMFQNLESGIFVNTPNEMSFFRDGRADVPSLNYTENGISGYLTQEGPARPDLGGKKWKYEDIWGQQNKAYNQTLGQGGYIADYQAAMAPRAGTAPGVFEGYFVRYLNSQIRDFRRGPIYLKKMVDSTENPSLIPMLRELADRFNSVANTCANNRGGLGHRLQSAYDSGRKLGPFGIGKGKVVEGYLQVLAECVANEEGAYRYSCMRDVALALIERLSIYRDRILKPLADALEAMPPIFRENLNVLTIQEQQARGNPDPSLLIYPLEFERKYNATFQNCVASATSGFLNAMAENLRYWVGRDVQSVNEDIAHGEDIIGFLSRYVSDAFATLYNNISMDAIMQAVMGTNVTLTQYVQTKTQELFDTSYAMFKAQNTGDYPTSAFEILSLPTGNPQLAAAAGGLPQANTPQVTVKDSREANCIYVVRAGVGYPLYGNAFIGDQWESAYENARTNPDSVASLHLYPEWTGLPSPYTEVAWPNTYRCESVAAANAQARADFDFCVEKNILVKQQDNRGVHAILYLADPAVDLDALLLTGTLYERKVQLGLVQGSLWAPGNSATICMERSSQFMGTGGDPDLNNIRENCLRYPEICSQLAEQREKLKKVEALQKELDDPQYFAWALQCELLRKRPGTNDDILVRQESDPMPVTVLRGTEDTSHEDGWLKIYTAFLSVLDRPGGRDDWRAIISGTLDNRRIINVNSEEKRAAFAQRAEEMGRQFRGREIDARNAALTKIGAEQSRYFAMADTYGFIAECFEALNRN